MCWLNQLVITHAKVRECFEKYKCLFYIYVSQSNLNGFLTR